MCIIGILVRLQFPCRGGVAPAQESEAAVDGSRKETVDRVSRLPGLSSIREPELMLVLPFEGYDNFMLCVFSLSRGSSLVVLSLSLPLSWIPTREGITFCSVFCFRAFFCFFVVFQEFSGSSF